MYLALDQGLSKIGWAIGAPEMVAPQFGVHWLPKVGRKHGVLLRDARDWLDGTIKKHGIVKIAFEAPFFGPNALVYAVTNKLIGVIELVADDNEIPCVEVPADDWRKRFIGCCRAPKKAGSQYHRRQWLKQKTIDACGERGWKVKNDDEADACGILDLVLALDDEAYGAATGAPLLQDSA